MQVRLVFPLATKQGPHRHRQR